MSSPTIATGPVEARKAAAAKWFCDLHVDVAVRSVVVKQDAAGRDNRVKSEVRERVADFDVALTDMVGVQSLLS